MNLPDILASFCTLNKDFESLNVQFYLYDRITEINDDKYYEHSVQDGEEMMRKYNSPDAFNVYI